MSLIPKLLDENMNQAAPDQFNVKLVQESGSELSPTCLDLMLLIEVDVLYASFWSHKKAIETLQQTIHFVFKIRL